MNNKFKIGDLVSVKSPTPGALSEEYDKGFTGVVSGIEKGLLEHGFYYYVTRGHNLYNSGPFPEDWLTKK